MHTKSLLCAVCLVTYTMIFSLCVVYILRATSSSPTLLQPRAVSPGVGAVLQPHKASRRPHSHSSGPGLIPSFPDLFQVHYTMYCTLGCSDNSSSMHNIIACERSGVECARAVCMKYTRIAKLLLRIFGIT